MISSSPEVSSTAQLTQVRTETLYGVKCPNEPEAKLQPDWIPFDSLGADVINKRKYKTGKVSDLPHIILLNMLLIRRANSLRV